MRLRKFETVDLDSILQAGREFYDTNENDPRFPHKPSVLLIGAAAIAGSVVITYSIYEFSTYVVEPIISKEIKPSPPSNPEATTSSLRPTPTDAPTTALTGAP